MSKGFQLETIIKENYQPDGEEQQEEEEKKEDDSFEIIESSDEENKSAISVIEDKE